VSFMDAQTIWQTIRRLSAANCSCVGWGVGGACLHNTPVSSLCPQEMQWMKQTCLPEASSTRPSSGTTGVWVRSSVSEVDTQFVVARSINHKCETAKHITSR
jgi:hypothetical protein